MVSYKKREKREKKEKIEKNKSVKRKYLKIICYYIITSNGNIQL